MTNSDSQFSLQTDVPPLRQAAMHVVKNLTGHEIYALLFALGVNSVAVYQGGGPRVVVSTAAFHARVRGPVPGLGGLKETKNVSSPSTCESQYCGEPP